MSGSNGIVRGMAVCTVGLALVGLGIAMFGDGSNEEVFGNRAANGGCYGGADPQFSSDGTRLILGIPRRGKAADIVTADLDGNGRRILFSSSSYAGQAKSVPGKKEIVFVSEKEKIAHLFAMQTDSRKLRKITDSEFPDSCPVVSSDGEQIAFKRHLSPNPDETRKEELFIVGINGAGERRLTSNDVPETPVAFSKDGKLLYFLYWGEREDLHTLDLASGKVQRVLPLHLKGASCAVSPDERLVAYVDDAEHPFEYEVFVSGIDGTNKKQLTHLRGYIGGVAFSPDSRRVVFLVGPKGECTRRGKVCTIDVQTGEMTVVLQPDAEFEMDEK